MRIFGKNVFKEINDCKKIKKVYLSKNIKDEEIYKVIKENNINFEIVDLNRLNNMVEGNHQGIVIDIRDYEYYSLNDILNENKIIMLDHLEDPHNFGAIIRSVEASGISSIIIPKNRSVDVNGTVMKTSAGSLEHVKIVMVNNLVDAIKTLKNNNYFVYGADMDGLDYKKVDYANKVCLVIGSEGNGISKLVKDNCDQIISIPMNGQVNSLNASVAASILIFDLIRRWFNGSKRLSR